MIFYQYAMTMIEYLAGLANYSQKTDIFCIPKFADLTTIRALNIPRVEENLII